MIQRYRQQYRIEYNKLCYKYTSLLPKAKKSLELAHQNAILGVVTTKTSKGSKKLLEHLGILHFFDTFIGIEDVANPKPHQEPILKALQSLNIQVNKNCWMIGDTSLDTLSAKNARINSIGVLTGYEDDKSLKIHATYVKKNTLEAVEFIIKKST